MNSKTMISICLLAAAPLTVHAQSAQAQKIYMCKDASGRTITSDRPIPECADRPVKELDSGGMVRREIGPPLSAEQRQQLKAEEEKKKAEAAAAAERKRSDQAIMARFRSEDDIALARKRNVDLVQDQIKRENAALANAEKRKKDLEGQMPAAKDKKDVMANLKRAMEELNQAIAGNKKKIQEYETEVAQLNEKYDATLKRYRELSGATAAK